MKHKHIVNALIIYKVKGYHVLIRMTCYFGNSKIIINVWFSNEWLCPISSCDCPKKIIFFMNYFFCTIPHEVFVLYIQGMLFHTIISFIWHQKCHSISTNESDMVLWNWPWCIENHKCQIFLKAYALMLQIQKPWLTHATRVPHNSTTLCFWSTVVPLLENKLATVTNIGSHYSFATNIRSYHKISNFRGCCTILNGRSIGHEPNKP